MLDSQGGTADKAPDTSTPVKKLRAEDAFLEARKKRTQTIQRWFAIIGVVAFGGSTIAMLAGIFTESLRSDRPMVETSTQTQAQQIEAELKKQRDGYQKVLTREPNNQSALENLVLLEIQLNNPKGAIPPLERLVKLNPQNLQYQEVLKQLKQAVENPLLVSPSAVPSPVPSPAASPATK